MYLRDINLQNILVKKRVGRNTGKIYYDGKKLQYTMSNVSISKVSGSVIYIKVNSVDLESVRKLEDHIESNIIQKEISESCYLNSNVYINRHKQNLIKVHVDFADMPKASSEDLYDIDIKCTYLTFNDDDTVNMDIHLSATDDIRLVPMPDSDLSDSDSDVSIVEEEEEEDDIGPTPDEILQIKSDMLQKLNKDISDKDLEIAELVGKNDKLKYYRQQLNDSSDISRILMAINEIDC
jgi:hypothetical protein